MSVEERVFDVPVKPISVTASIGEFSKGADVESKTCPDESVLELETVYEIGITEAECDQKTETFDLDDVDIPEEILNELIHGKVDFAYFLKMGMPLESVMAMEREILGGLASMSFGSDPRSEEAKRRLPVKTGDPMALIALYEQSDERISETGEKGCEITCIGMLCDVKVFVPEEAVTNKVDARQFLCRVHKNVLETT